MLKRLNTILNFPVKQLLDPMWHLLECASRPIYVPYYYYYNFIIWSKVTIVVFVIFYTEKPNWYLQDKEQRCAPSWLVLWSWRGCVSNFRCYCVMRRDGNSCMCMSRLSVCIIFKGCCLLYCFFIEAKFSDPLDGYRQTIEATRRFVLAVACYLCYLHYWGSLSIFLDTKGCVAPRLLQTMCYSLSLSLFHLSWVSIVPGKLDFR